MLKNKVRYNNFKSWLGYCLEEHWQISKRSSVKGASPCNFKTSKNLTRFNKPLRIIFLSLCPLNFFEYALFPTGGKYTAVSAFILGLFCICQCGQMGLWRALSISPFVTKSLPFFNVLVID